MVFGVLMNLSRTRSLVWRTLLALAEMSISWLHDTEYIGIAVLRSLKRQAVFYRDSDSVEV